MRLYYSPLSSNARRARLAALQLGLAVDFVPVDLPKSEHRTPEFLRKNPNGLVPVLEDGDLLLTESHAIMQYLADKTPGQTLYPQELAARADVNRWLFWNASHFQPAVSVLNWEHVVKAIIGLGAPVPSEVARGTALLTRHAAVLEGHLDGKEWIAQGRLTLADLAICTPLMTMVPAKLPLGDFKNVLAWFERMQALECWKATAK